MANIKDCPGFETFGADVKEARKAKNLARKDLAENQSIFLQKRIARDHGTDPVLYLQIRLREERRD